MAAAGRALADAGVRAIYLVHGTFAGNDALGLFTELARFAPGFAGTLRRLSKKGFDALIGETGNYTREFAQRMEAALSAGGDRPLPVRNFYWASQNHHVGRADSAVLLIDDLARLAETSVPAPSPSRGRDQLSTGDPKSLERTAVAFSKQPGRAEEGYLQHITPPPSPPRQGEGGGERRVLLWGHSHGGNAFALVTNLLGGDAAVRAEFFQAAQIFFRRPWSHRVDIPAWQRVEQLLAEPDHPVRRLQLDFVTFGTPVRYGWDSGGYSKLLHIINHRPAPGMPEFLAPFPRVPRMWRAVDGDYVQQIGIAGSNLPPLPLAWRTFLADRRLSRLLQRDLPHEGLLTRLRRGMLVPDEGATLLVDYDDPARTPVGHLFGHAQYTRIRWLAFHCDLIARHFYGDQPAMV
jgi:hypothetical protein